MRSGIKKSLINPCAIPENFRQEQLESTASKRLCRERRLRAWLYTHNREEQVYAD